MTSNQIKHVYLDPTTQKWVQQHRQPIVGEIVFLIKQIITNESGVETSTDQDPRMKVSQDTDWSKYAFQITTKGIEDEEKAVRHLFALDSTKKQILQVLVSMGEIETEEEIECLSNRIYFDSWTSTLKR